MKGAKTEPFAKINSPPNTDAIVIIGRSHNFFLSTRNDKSSFIKSIFKI